jgi:hypothetical protein
MKDFEATEAWPLYQSRFAYFSRIKVNKIPSFYQFLLPVPEEKIRRKKISNPPSLSLSLSLSL